MMLLTRGMAAFFIFVLVGGAMATASQVVTHQLAYVLGLVVIGTLLAVTVLTLRGPLVQDIPILIALALIFSSYCVKLLLIVVDPDSPVTLGMLPRIGTHNPDVPSLWMGALSLTTYGIAAFCLVTTVLSRIERLPEQATKLRIPVILGDGFWWGAGVAVLLLSLATAGLSYYFDIGLMGSNAKVHLPFHLRGVIFYTRSFVLTGALLMLANLAQQRSRYLYFWWAIGLLVINGVADSIIHSSKSAILAPFLYIFFLIVASGMPVGRRMILLAVMAIVPCLLALPYLNNLRVFRAAGHDVLSAILLTVSSTPFSPLESVWKSLIWIVYRLPGIEIIMGILGHSPIPSNANLWDIFSRPTGVAGFLTNDVFLVPADHPHLAAPSYFGWWYLILGTPGVVVGGALLALIVRLGWQFVLRLSNQSAVILRVFFLMLLFNAVSEGTLDMLAKTIVAMVITVLLIEFGMKTYLHFSFKQTASANA